MKWLKFLIRKYTLLEHSLIVDALAKQINPYCKGISYDNVLDISRHGLIDVYASPDDEERNRQYIIKSVAKDKDFLRKSIEDGERKVNALSELPDRLLEGIKAMPAEQIAQELLKLREIFFKFSPYIDFIHYTERSGVKVDAELAARIALFNDKRKSVFMNFLAFVCKVGVEIARKEHVKANDLSYLTFNELIALLNNKLSLKEANETGLKRSERYIMIAIGGKQRIVTDDFDKELEKLKEDMVEAEASDEIKGVAINKGMISGEVKVISQATSLAGIRPGKVIVTHQTKPDMTPYLKGAIAIVTDEGGVLCHAANLAREFGIVGIVGTKNATKLLKDGDIVEVDATNGVVRLVKKS